MKTVEDPRRAGVDSAGALREPLGPAADLAAAERRPRDGLIDGWRGVSIIAVVVGHALRLRYTDWQDVVPAWSAEVLLRVAEITAATGVKIFFVISGYVITTLLMAEERSFGRISIGAFYVRRSARILPAFAVYVATCIVLRHADIIGFSDDTLIRAVTFRCNLDGADCSWFLLHTWSLATEEQFYLVFPLLFSVTLPLWRVAITLVVLGGLTLMSAGGVTHAAAPFACITVGVLGAQAPALLRAVRNITRGRYLAGAFLVLYAVSLVPPMFPLSGCIRAIIPILIGYLLFCSMHVPFLRSAGGCAPLQFVGRISYSLYLWQQLFLGWPAWYPQANPLPIVLLPLCVIASRFSIEKPFISFGIIGLKWMSRVKRNDDCCRS